MLLTHITKTANVWFYKVTFTFFSSKDGSLLSLRFISYAAYLSHFKPWTYKMIFILMKTELLKHCFLLKRLDLQLCADSIQYVAVCTMSTT